MSSVTLTHFLGWFVTMANHVQDVRNYAMVDFCVLRRSGAGAGAGVGGDSNSDSNSDSSDQYYPTSFSQHMQIRAQSVLRRLLDDVEMEVGGWQRRVLQCNGYDMLSEESDSAVTLVRMYVWLRKVWWKGIAQAVRVTDSLIGMDFLPTGIGTGVSMQDRRGGVGTDIPPACNGDVSQHEHVLAVLEMLKHETDMLQLLHCHPQMSVVHDEEPAAVAPSACVSVCVSRQYDREDKEKEEKKEEDEREEEEGIRCSSSSLSLRLHFRSSSSLKQVNFTRDAFFALQAEYAASLMTWVHAAAGGGGGGGAAGGGMGAKSLLGAGFRSDSELMGGFGGLHTRGK